MTEVKAGELVISDRVRDWASDASVCRHISKALARWMDVEEFMAQIFIALNAPEIRHCTPMSKFEALHKCASLQLLPTTDQVAFIPYDNTVNGKKQLEVSVMPQWQGYKALMERHPDVREVEAEIVFVGEHYHFDSSDRSFEHVYDPFENRDVLEDLSNVKGGYLRITYTDGRPAKFHFVTANTILKARSCAKTLKIWRPHPRPMTLKTVYRDGYARRVVPIDPLVNRKMNELLEVEDLLHQNDPTRATIDRAPKQSLASVTEQIEKSTRISRKDPVVTKVTKVATVVSETPESDEPSAEDLEYIYEQEAEHSTE